MREILFRGKRADNGEWVAGGISFGLCQTPYICPTMQNIEVIPETVGQYTGLTDKNGRKIFEGDIIKARHNVDTYLVSFIDGRFTIKDEYDCSLTVRQEVIDKLGAEVIGNIYDDDDLWEKR